MATQKVYVTTQREVIKAVYATMTTSEIAQIRLMFDVDRYTPHSEGKYHFTSSMNPVDVVLEVAPDDYDNIIAELSDYTDYIPWGNFGLDIKSQSDLYDLC